MDTSPSKRRVLGSVDVNSRTPGAISKFSDMSKSQVAPIPLNRNDFGTAKRPLNQESICQPQQYQLEQPAKRRRVSVDNDDARPDVASGEHGDEESSNYRDATNHDDYDVENQQPDSPDEESSMFDNSAIDTSQDTMITEPDAEMLAPVPPLLSPPRRQPSMTREEARRKAEKLRLRLGLASYKVRTGQTDVPLERLQVKPLLGTRSRSSSNNLAQQEQPSLPPLSPQPEPTSDDFEVEKVDENEDEDQRRNRLAAVARKALPSAPPLRQGHSSGAGSPAGRKLLPGLPNGSQRAY
ncbi:hypothetical protein GGR53DRAFT_238495 [Hypoxylon sp. FL1150]|nr:hypothetical protein GGR53DRAFT_238495 [Hypoxylon sp. FL1150]